MNISFNKSLKNNLKIFWEDWIINGYYIFIKGGNTKSAFDYEIMSFDNTRIYKNGLQNISLLKNITLFS